MSVVAEPLQVSVKAGAEYKKEDAHFIFEIRSDEFPTCVNKIVPVRKWLWTKKYIVHHNPKCHFEVWKAP